MTLGETQLNATASTDGTQVYTPPTGTVLNAGNNQNLHVDFTPMDAANFIPASKDVKINVLKAPLAITADDKIKKFGEPLPPFTATFTSFVNNDTEDTLTVPLKFTTTANDSSPAGAYSIIPSEAASPNYQIAFQNGTLTIQPADAKPVLTLIRNGNQIIITWTAGGILE